MEAHWHQLNRDVHRLIEMVKHLTHKVDRMAIDISDLTNAVAREKTVIDSVIALLTGLSTKIQELVDQLANADADATAQIKAQLSAVVSDINTESDALAAAVVANTPQAKPTPTSSKG